MQEAWINPWVGKITWRRAWLPTPVFLPGEPPWTKEPGGLQSMGSQRVRHDWATEQQQIYHLSISVSKDSYLSIYLSIHPSICLYLVFVVLVHISPKMMGLKWKHPCRLALFYTHSLTALVGGEGVGEETRILKKKSWNKKWAGRGL